MDETKPLDDLPPTKNIYGAILGAGARVGSYIVDELASHGGFAAVYRAHHWHTGEPAALKILSAMLAVSPRMLERFQQEAETLRRLRHPNIVEIFEFDELYPGRPYIAMEWLDGRNLGQELAIRGTFSVDEALAILVEVGDALACAHGQGVIHRDLKAQNIMAVPRQAWFAVKLVDFGIAKLLAAEDQHQSMTTRTVIGTPQTMAPEQILRQPVDERTDIYAMGLLFYQLLCGRLPFVSDNIVELEHLHLYAPPPRVSEHAGVPAAFDEVLQRALQKRPEDRHASVSELIAELRRAARAAPASSGNAESAVMAGLGIAVELRVPDAAGVSETEILDEMDDVLDRIAELFARLGLDALLTTASTMLAVAILPGASSEKRARQQAIIAAMHDWYRAWSDEPWSRQIELCITIHGADVVVQRRGEQTRCVDGVLLQLGQWPARPPLAGLVVTRTAHAGLEDVFPWRSLVENPEFHLIGSPSTSGNGSRS